MISDYLSVKLKVVSFLLMILVVFIHSYNVNNSAVERESAVFLIESFLGAGLALIAVPLFFVISGYLFFLTFDGSYFKLWKKIEKRFSTLLLPFVFWAIFSVAIYLVIQTFPKFDHFFNQKLIKNFTIGELFIKTFLDPFAYQLWFLRDLIVIIFFTPVIFWFLRLAPMLTISISLIVWLLNLNLFVIYNGSLPFFLIGSWLGLTNKIKLDRLPAKVTSFAFGIWGAILLLMTYLISQDLDSIFQYNLIKNISIVIGIFAFWGGYDLLFDLVSRRVKVLAPITSFAFFLYGFHEPFLTFIKKVLFVVFGKEQLDYLLIYFLAPIVVIFASLTVGFYTKKILPKFYDAITGGR